MTSCLISAFTDTATCRTSSSSFRHHQFDKGEKPTPQGEVDLQVHPLLSQVAGHF